MAVLAFALDMFAGHDSSASLRRQGASMQTNNIDFSRFTARAIALIFAFGVPFAPSFSAHAFEVTEAQKEACTPDAFRLCSAAIPDANRVAACMAANVANLSPACRAAFHPAVARAEATRGNRHHVHRVLTSYERRHHHHLMRDADSSWGRD